MADLSLHEIDDAVRRDKMMAWVKTYGPMLSAIVVLVLVGVGGTQAWRHWQDKQAMSRASAYTEALAAANKEEAQSALAALVEQNRTDGYAALALLKQAALQQDAEQYDAAVQTYLSLAHEPKADPAFRQLGLLLAGYTALDKTDASTVAPDIEAAAKSADAVFPGLLKEWLSLWYLKQGEREKAAALLKELAEDASAPQALQHRAERMAHVLAQGN